MPFGLDVRVRSHHLVVWPLNHRPPFVLFVLPPPQLPYSQTTYDTNDPDSVLATQRSAELLRMRNDADVLAIRDEVQADLVLLIGEVPGTCGLG